MALASIGPWNEVTPQFFTSAMEQGARLGLAARQQDETETAADRLKFAYDSLASKEKLAAQTARINQQHQAAQMLLEVSKQNALQDFRKQELQDRLSIAAGVQATAADRLKETQSHNLAMEDIGQQREEGLESRSKKDAKITLEPQAGTDEQGTLSGSVNDPAIQERLAGRKLRAAQTGKHDWADWLKGKLGVGTAKPAPAPAPKEVTRKTKDGRIAVFDADTKKFLRYADSDMGGNQPASK